MNKEYWEQRYTNQETGWDIGSASTPLKEYIEQLENKNLKILIPGAGNGHEVSLLHELGFNQVYILDIAKQPLDRFKINNPNFPIDHILHQDFFELQITFDLIIEQTFFCALPPLLRPDYTKKMYESLNDSGKLVGVLFDFPLTEKGPPFGGSKTEYHTYFKPYFQVNTMEKCYNSIKPRQGNELFVIFEKQIKTLL